MLDWIREKSQEITRDAEAHLEALVAVSSPSGDVAGAEACVSVCEQLLPAAARVERVPCSSPATRLT